MPDTKVATIDLLPRSVTLRKEGDFFEGTYSLNLTNSRGFAFAARIEVKQPEGAAGADWVSIPSARTLVDFPADKLEAITVSVRVPISAAKSAPAVHRFTVKVMDKALPDELTDTQTAELVIPARKGPPPPRWLIPLVVGAAVLVLGGGGLALYHALARPKDLRAGDTCDPTKSRCPEGIACHATKKRCLLTIGRHCEEGPQCTTGRCGATGTCGWLQLGDACEPGDSGCKGGLACSETRRECVTIPGLDVGDAPVWGPRDAPVTMIGFRDFQGPFDARVVPTLKQLERDYDGKLRIVFKQKPMPFHAQAQLAAEAALAADEQGSFWPYHDKLYGGQPVDLTRPALERYARELNLNMSKFQEALDQRRFKPRIERDIAQANAAGASGVPTFFINGTKVAGAQPIETFKKAIDEALARR